MEIYAVKIPDIVQEEYLEHLLRYIDLNKRKKINKFHDVKDKIRSILGDILLRIIVSKKCNLKNIAISYDYNKFKKLYINGIENFHFNVSHSGEWVVCAVDEEEIGIDVEEIKPLDQNVIQCFCSDDELKYLMKIETEELKQEYIYDIWTLKESYVKNIGAGLNISLKSFTILNEGKLLTLKDSDNSNKSYFFRQYFIDKKYKLSICSNNDNFPLEVNVKDFYSVYSDSAILT